MVTNMVGSWSDCEFGHHHLRTGSNGAKITEFPSVTWDLEFFFEILAYYLMRVWPPLASPSRFQTDFRHSWRHGEAHLVPLNLVSLSLLSFFWQLEPKLQGDFDPRGWVTYIAARNIGFWYQVSMQRLYRILCSVLTRTIDFCYYN
jgi:hypothetical protein